MTRFFSALLVSIAVLAAIAPSAISQSAPAAPTQLPAVRGEARFVPKPPSAPQEIAERPPAQPPPPPRAPLVQGIVGQILRSLNPLQLFNPFAPGYYGSGQQNVITDTSLVRAYASQPAIVVVGIEEK